MPCSLKNDAGVEPYASREGRCRPDRPRIERHGPARQVREPFEPLGDEQASENLACAKSDATLEHGSRRRRGHVDALPRDLDDAALRECASAPAIDGSTRGRGGEQGALGEARSVRAAPRGFRAELAAKLERRGAPRGTAE